MLHRPGQHGRDVAAELLRCARIFQDSPGDVSHRPLALADGRDFGGFGIPTRIFGGFLEGLQRFYITNLTNVVATLLRTVLIVVVLNRGYGLLMVAFITIILPLLASILRAIIAAAYPSRSAQRKYVDRPTFRRIVNYSSSTFLIIGGGPSEVQDDEIVIGTMLSRRRLPISTSATGSWTTRDRSLQRWRKSSHPVEPVGSEGRHEPAA